MLLLQAAPFRSAALISGDQLKNSRCSESTRLECNWKAWARSSNIPTMIRFEDILAKVEKFHPNEDLNILRRAYVFSAKEHHGQIRKSGEPYFNHPLAVADILAEMKLDAVCVTVGLLHDVVEDTSAPLEVIEEQFGKDVANIVNGLTKINQFQFYSKEEQQAENFRKMFLAMVDDVRVVLVKLADRLHNMRTLQFLPPEKRHRISLETMEIYAPIAHRLGMGKMRGELEDLADRKSVV